MKKIYLILFLSLISLPCLFALGQQDAFHRPSIRDFTSVSIHIPAQTIIEKGNRHSIDIELPEKLDKHIHIYNERGTLIIKSQRGSWIKKTDNIRIRITMPYWHELEMTGSGILSSEEDWNLKDASIRISGSGNVHIKSIKADEMELKLSGSGDINIDRLLSRDVVDAESTGSGRIQLRECQTDLIEVRLTGSGDVRVSGSVEKAELRTTGSGDIAAGELLVDEAYIKITGSGDVSLKDGSRLKEIKMTGSGTYRSL